MKRILYTNSFNQEINEPVDVILSPHFYWIKKIEIPVKKLKDAREIAPTLFKLERESHIFDVFKLDNGYFAVAFPKKLELKIPPKFIRSVRIAQIEFYPYDCLKIDSNTALKKIDDLIFCFPGKVECPSVDEILPQLELSPKTFPLFNRLEIDKRVLIPALGIFLLFNLGFLVRWYGDTQQLKRLEAERSAYLTRHHLPSTTFQLEAILEELRQKWNSQLHWKRGLAIITKTPLKPGESFRKIAFDSNRFTIEVTTHRNLNPYFLSHKFKIVESQLEKGTYRATLQWR